MTLGLLGVGGEYTTESSKKRQKSNLQLLLTFATVISYKFVEELFINLLFIIFLQQYLEQRKVGLKIFLLTDVLPNINCEEDLEVILKYQDNIQTDGEYTIQNEHFDVSTSQ
ncbi:hypothetical protein CWI39_2343p0010, partial [Hamiltosporidium magnivora]